MAFFICAECGTKHGSRREWEVHMSAAHQHCAEKDDDDDDHPVEQARQPADAINTAHLAGQLTASASIAPLHTQQRQPSAAITFTTATPSATCAHVRAGNNEAHQPVSAKTSASDLSSHLSHAETVARGQRGRSRLLPAQPVDQLQSSKAASASQPGGDLEQSLAIDQQQEQQQQLHGQQVVSTHSAESNLALSLGVPAELPAAALATSSSAPQQGGDSSAPIVCRQCGKPHDSRPSLLAHLFEAHGIARGRPKVTLGKSVKGTPARPSSGEPIAADTSILAMATQAAAAAAAAIGRSRCHTTSVPPVKTAVVPSVAPAAVPAEQASAEATGGATASAAAARQAGRQRRSSGKQRAAAFARAVEKQVAHQVVTPAADASDVALPSTSSTIATGVSNGGAEGGTGGGRERQSGRRRSGGGGGSRRSSGVMNSTASGQQEQQQQPQQQQQLLRPSANALTDAVLTVPVVAERRGGRSRLRSVTEGQAVDNGGEAPESRGQRLGRAGRGRRAGAGGIVPDGQVADGGLVGGVQDAGA